MLKTKSMKSVIIGGVIITAAGVGAYMMKSIALEQEQKLALISAQISEEKDKITVLEADWSYLTRPARIQQLSRDMLSFAPVDPERILTLDTLDIPSIEEDSENNLYQIKTIQGVK